MSDIKTVILDGAELKVEGMSGQNTVIVNRGSAALYASVSANVTPDGDNTAAIPSGGIMNLRGTNGTVYLLGTGKVELEGTDYADIGRAAVVSSGGSGGGSGGGVSQEYVDSANAVILSSAKKYTDSEIVKAKAYTDAESDKLSGELSDLKAYIGYTDSDIYGLEADFENNKFTRLAGAVGKNPGADFDSINAFGGRRRCNVYTNGAVVYDSTDTDGWDTSVVDVKQRLFSVMVEQPNKAALGKSGAANFLKGNSNDIF